MSKRSPRFEICRGDDGWWARFRAANGRVVWVTETYTRQHAAWSAIGALCSGSFTKGVDGKWRVRQRDAIVLEVRETDER